ncbi:MAG: hypothetical protein HQ547_00520 [Candidatus Omnitrophica bacterium]|nr:hypothetical protein [Candidatus Omnitrophota bacterium]
MLKRTQVLLEDWQVDYIKRSAEKFDFSFSEVVRILVSEAALSILFSMEPKKKVGITPKKLIAMKKRVLDRNTSSEERHKIISDVYFEARKATEHNIGRT